MKKILLLAFIVFFLSASCSSCDKNVTEPRPDNNGNNNPIDTQNTMQITIGNTTFTATLNDKATADSFKKMLPMTLNMIELNGNEKYYDFPRNFPFNASNLGTIQNGDLMLYSSNTLVLFYKSFSTSYSYTKLGRINDVTGLVAALGKGNVTVTFELE